MIAFNETPPQGTVRDWLDQQAEARGEGQHQRRAGFGGGINRWVRASGCPVRLDHHHAAHLLLDIEILIPREE